MALKLNIDEKKVAELLREWILIWNKLEKKEFDEATKDLLEIIY